MLRVRAHRESTAPHSATWRRVNRGLSQAVLTKASQSAGSMRDRLGLTETQLAELKRSERTPVP